MLYIEIVALLSLILLNGFLAMSEIAVLSSRRARLETLANSGNPGARTALLLSADPGRFLSTVQIGITAVSVLAGAFSGATLAARLGSWFDTIPGMAPNGERFAIAAIVLLVTYLTLVVGELVPKRIALARPERISTRIARTMQLLAMAAAPAVWLLKKSTEGVLALLGLRHVRRSPISEDEIRAVVAEGTRAGILAPEEQGMIEGVLRLADRRARAVMTPRTELSWINASDPARVIAETLRKAPFSRLPVCDGTIDHPIGIVHAKHLLPQAIGGGGTIDVRAAMMPAIIIPETMPVLALLDRFRREGVHMAIVVNEYGTTEGAITPTDLLETIAGDLPERGETRGRFMTERADGSWLVDGLTPLDEFCDRTGVRNLETNKRFDTVAGFALHCLGRLPSEGESFDYRGTRFEILDLDGRRIDKLAVYPAAQDD
jgi:putative hemolysin